MGTGAKTINSHTLVVSKAGVTNWAGGGKTINNGTLVTSRVGTPPLGRGERGRNHHLGRGGKTMNSYTLATSRLEITTWAGGRRQ